MPKEILKTIIVLNAFFTIGLLLFNACEFPENNANKQIISVSILPQKFFIEKIAGDAFTINVLIPPGASPENYDATPKQIKALETSILYLKAGYIEFERNWIDEMANNFPLLKIVDTSTGIELLQDKNDHHNNHHHSSWIEPHLWMSPKNVKVISNTIFQSLVSIKPDQKEVFKRNLDNFLKQLEDLDTMIRSNLQPTTSKAFIIYHPALTYYANDYQLQQISIELDGKNPSARHIREVIDRAKKENIKLIFVQKQFDQSKAMTIAHEINGEVVPIDPLAYDWESEIKLITQKLALFLN